MDIHTILINSKNRTSGTSHKFAIGLKNGITYVDSFAIGAIKIPKSYYNVTSLNNRFRFVDSTATTHDLTLAAGNYDITQLITWLSVNMNIVSTDTYHFNLNQLTNKLDVSTAAGSWSLDFTIDNNMSVLLGFDNQIYESSVNSIGEQGITAVNSPSLDRTDRIHIICNEIHRDNYHFNDTLGFGNILDTVIDNAPFGGYVTKEQDFNIFYNLPSVNFISSMYFRLVDDNGNDLDLNGLDWTIEIHIRVKMK